MMMRTGAQRLNSTENCCCYNMEVFNRKAEFPLSVICVQEVVRGLSCLPWTCQSRTASYVTWIGRHSTG